MKYLQSDFTPELEKQISKLETELLNEMDVFLREYKPLFAEKNLIFEAEYEREGEHPFSPGYTSSLSFGVSEKDGELLDLHIIKIWECVSSFLGMPVSKNVPGSKVSGELLDESLEEVRLELADFIQEHLEG